MWISKCKYKMELSELKQRIKYLENILCPNESHTYKKVDSYFVGGTGHGDEQPISIYKCLKCGKTCEKMW